MKEKGQVPCPKQTGNLSLCIMWKHNSLEIPIAYVKGCILIKWLSLCLSVSIKNSIFMSSVIILLTKLESVLKIYPSTRILVPGRTGTTINIFYGHSLYSSPFLNDLGTVFHLRGFLEPAIFYLNVNPFLSVEIDIFCE
jgi:hypothetical protein